MMRWHYTKSNVERALKYIGFIFLLIGLGLSLCVNAHLRQYQKPPYSPTFLPQWIGSLYDDLKFMELTNKLPESYDEMLGLTGRCSNQLKSAIFYNLSFTDLANMEIGRGMTNLQAAIECNSDNTDARYNWELLAQQREESGSNGIPQEGEGDKLFREKEQERQGKYGTGGATTGW